MNFLSGKVSVCEFIIFKFYKHQKRREDVVMHPECIIRGNLCEFKIRSITTEMKKHSDKILSLLKKLEEIES